jgi:hypothetical protein
LLGFPHGLPTKSLSQSYRLDEQPVQNRERSEQVKERQSQFDFSGKTTAL